MLLLSHYVSHRLFSASIHGIDAQLIEVEVDSSPGLHKFTIVGLPDKAIQESVDRISSALRNTKLQPPGSKHKKIIINLAPADVKKMGPAFDLPIALAYLLESGQIKFNAEDTMFLGELSLKGNIKPVSGILSAAILAKKLGIKNIAVPYGNAKEASVVKGLSVYGCSHISDVINHLTRNLVLNPEKHVPSVTKELTLESYSLCSIKGQEVAKRALLIAAAGKHNILFSGPPGTGKTLLAKAFSELLPALSFDEAIEVARIYSSAGLLKNSQISFTPPFRNPHHTISPPALIGGGAHPKPGEISLAHCGVLFLDELPEFPRNVLESLRQPLEEGLVTVSRTAGAITLPARFTLIAAMNPCPCGNYGEEKAECICAPFAIHRYRKKISGPLLDRMDLQITVPRETVSLKKAGMDFDQIRTIKNLITSSRKIQKQRLEKLGINYNSEISFKQVDKICLLDPKAEATLDRAIDVKGLSLRTYHKLKKIARTIADLEQSELIKENHVAEALSLRVNDQISGI